MIVRLWRLALKVQRVIAKAVDVLGQVWADVGQRVLGHTVALSFQFAHDPRQRADIVEDEQLVTRWLYLITLRC